MKTLSILALAVFFLPLAAQVPVAPATIPHITFVDASGQPCSSCTLQSFAAGTTTPVATYVDSLGISTNTNPIVLDAAGGANIWLANSAYKFILKTAAGATIWSVDQVKGGGGLGGVCGPAGAVQIANSGVNGLTCDATIIINTTNHTLTVGTLPANHVTMVALGTPTSWTFDTTTPATALASLGPVPLTDLATMAADSVVMNATLGIASPTAVAMPTGCTLGVNYSTATHLWTCAATSIPLTSLAAQAADTVVMNATAGSAPPTAVAMPTGCTFLNYDTSTHAWACATSPAYNPADHDVSLSRAFGTSYQNTNSGPMRIYGFGNTGGSSVGSTEVKIGSASPSSSTFANTCPATVSGGVCGFVGEVPAGWFYAVIANSKTGGPTAVGSVTSWHEVY